MSYTLKITEREKQSMGEHDNSAGNKYNGKLSDEELERLKNASISDKQIEQIKIFLEENKELLSGFEDVVGDKQIPTKQFFFNIKYIGNLLDDKPERVLSKFGVTLRGMTTARLVRLLGANFMACRQIFEDRNELYGDSIHKNFSKKIRLPKEPVIWVPNHHFKDDALASIRVAQRPVTLMFGSLPLYFNSTDGILAYLEGSILINRKVKRSKGAAIPKAKRAVEFGSDLLWYPEGVHNKTSNKLVLDLWNGIYRTANETGTKIIPIVHYIFDPTLKIISKELNPIHTVIDDPIDLTKFSEKAGLEYVRDVIATWYYLMMEKYGRMSRNDLLHAYQERAHYYGIPGEAFEKKPITFNEIGELYNMDLRSTVSEYDKKVETNAAYHPKTIISPEKAFDNIANIKHSNLKNVWNVIEASKLVRERKQEDFQSRF